MSLPANLVVDANAIVSAVMGFNALQIFIAPGVTFHTTQWTVNEVWSHIPAISKKRKVPAEWMQDNLMLLPLTVYGPAAYAQRVAEAKQRISDPKDEELLALELAIPSGRTTKTSSKRASRSTPAPSFLRYSARTIRRSPARRRRTLPSCARPWLKGCR